MPMHVDQFITKDLCACNFNAVDVQKSAAKCVFRCIECPEIEYRESACNQVKHTCILTNQSV